jgi:hypothetical protein
MPSRPLGWEESNAGWHGVVVTICVGKTTLLPPQNDALFICILPYIATFVLPLCLDLPASDDYLMTVALMKKNGGGWDPAASA